MNLLGEDYIARHMIDQENKHKVMGRSMKKYKTVNQVQKALDIKDWRKLSKDKVVKFAAMMPDIDNEVRIKIIENFPNFSEFVIQVLGEMKETVISTMDHNSTDYQAALNIISESQKIIGSQLDRDDISEELRIKLLDYLMELTKMIPSLDKENKKFLLNINKDMVHGALAIIGLGIVVLGGKILINGLGGEEDEEELTDDIIDVDCDDKV